MDAQAELIFTIMSSIAQEESRSISENVRWGKQRSMEAGKVYVPYSCFLGYERGEDGFPKIVEEEAKTVRDIYRRYLHGESLNGIAAALNKEGIATPTGKKVWRSGTIRRILTNEKYKGDARLQKTYVEDFLTKKVKINTGEHKQIYIHDSHDPIVTAETFELVQKELARRSGRNGRFHDSPFALKLICGDCGNPYGHRIWHSNEPCRKEVWMCRAKYDNGSICNTPAITEQAIISAFIEFVNGFSCHKEYADLYEKQFLSSIGDTANLQKQLDAVTNELNDAIDIIEKMIAENAHRSQDQDAYSEEYNKKSAEIDSLKKRTQVLQDMISVELARRENARIFLEGLKSIDNDNALSQFDVRLWHTLVDYATIMPDKTISFHLRNGEDKTFALTETTKAV